jgi:phage FluMu protein Com
MTTRIAPALSGDPAMLQTVTCPHCTRTLAINSQYLGQSVQCPLCKEAFVPSISPEGIQPTPSVPLDLPRPAPLLVDKPAAVSSAAMSGSPGQVFADRARIDLSETHTVQVGTAREANKRLEHWKEALPTATSAFTPSGKLPAVAIGFMSVGAVLGAVGGAVTGIVLAALTAVLCYGIGWGLDLMANFCGRVLCIVVVLGFGVALVGAGLSFAGLGWAAAAITTRMGQVGKNRNAPMAALFSVISATLALVLVFLALGVLGQFIEPGQAAKTWGDWIDWVMLIVLILGCGLGLCVAGCVGHGTVTSSKFCEECEQYMEEKKLPGLGLGALKGVTRALDNRRLHEAVELLDVQPGEEGKSSLFRCPLCGRGYVEVTARFKCTWIKDDETENKEESWLTASVELEQHEVDLFREALVEK